MEFQEYIKQRNRMFNSIGRYSGHCYGVNCDKCHNLNEEEECFTEVENNTPEKAEAIVQKWSEEHPVITNADKFKEVFGTEPTNDMLGWICPPLSVRKYKCDDRYCPDCQNWWRAEYKEPER